MTFLGKKVTVQSGELFETLDVTSLPMGIYIVSVSDESGNELLSEAIKVAR